MFQIYPIQTGVPISIILGLFLGIIVLAIYVHSRSLSLLTVLGIYSIAAFSSVWASEAFFAESVKTALYVIVFIAATVAVMMILRFVKE
jgi:hypothetical protein